MKHSLFKNAEEHHVKRAQQGLFSYGAILFLGVLLFLFSSVVSFGQTERKITGNVLDEQGVPLPGANVQVKGTNKGVSTDANGKYTITVDLLLYSGEELSDGFFRRTSESNALGSEEVFKVP